MSTEKTKQCTLCGKIKEEKSDFYYQKTDGRYYSWCKECFSANQIEIWEDRKKKCIGVMGGKCQVCGYDKNYAALEFHHIDPKNKEYNWNQLKKQKWETILKEIEKCVMLCSNCHRELHNPQAFDFDFRINEANKKKMLRKNKKKRERIRNAKKRRLRGKCVICGNDIYSGTKYCSKDCYGKSCHRIERPSKEVLEQLITEKSMKQLGKEYGVSDIAVRKWCIKYGIDLSKAKYAQNKG